ncbi:tRNA (adenosine(37)-N6)-threonylcarbamoyltransferase complex ATPase subunit type 1 TsaE [Gramella sp. AN32]|uniref:tRNA threonylcarbamoyladenosine biosynthesis protein TsaE n=1 Tax=Christiangramia antarctica TaxID=2058158 RepID=A0ABW5X5W7_9FLAO|nr:tRNA (adenosine(37)-N6)-threonylcarbamoyltransferase complex ATPase subunit type 1 TsaE [Gramella sp. AN32]MCM4156080.1 tRNA (adenosine(37)-N6)-threonylcarbamoyltransferase complex ATPase subunit type 1 TsaE [Gramella sp. AN32]
MELTYKLRELDTAVKFILENTKSKTLLFYGEMGAGKTTLIKELVKALGVTGATSSPTFSLVNHYDSDEGSVYHFDLYRLNDESEALDIGIEDYLDSDNWILIEWPEKIKNLMGENTQKLIIKVMSSEERMLKFC